MEKIDLEVDDFINYCDYKNLSVKTIGSYEQKLKLFTLYLKKEWKVKEVGEVKEIHIMEYMKHLQEIGKYTVVSNENTKSFCTFRNHFALFLKCVFWHFYVNMVKLYICNKWKRRRKYVSVKIWFSTI